MRAVSVRGLGYERLGAKLGELMNRLFSILGN